MKKINGRAKGAAGEREFCQWLKDKLELDFLPTRNLEQTREGGADVLGVRPFCFEVKRCQGLALKHWWLQVCQARRPDETAVVAFRQNNQPWRFLVSATLIGLDVGFIQLEEKVAIKWLKARMHK